MPARRMLVVAVLVVAVALAGASCGGSSAAAHPPQVRPHTDAKLIIVSPTPNEVTGPDLEIKFQVIGGTILPPAQATGPLQGDQGHIHVSLDGKLVQMAYAAQAQLSNLSPGQHALSAEWVASDHLPFANRVTAYVLFTVQG